MMRLGYARRNVLDYILLFSFEGLEGLFRLRHSTEARGLHPRIDFHERVHVIQCDDVPIHHMQAMELQHDPADLQKPHRDPRRQMQSYDDADGGFGIVAILFGAPSFN